MILFTVTAAIAGAQPVDRLPDMIVLPDFLLDTSLDTRSIPGRVLFRLSVATANVGEGALEIQGDEVQGPTGRDVFQRIYRSDGTWWERLAGTFTHHDEHGHVHFDDWTVFRLMEITAGEGVGDLVAQGDKTSFCLLDLIVDDVSNPFFAFPATYRGCGTTIQGISPGWADLYDRSLPGQSIDITDVPEGEYWLEVEVDPEDRVLEIDETNNFSRVRVAIGPPPPLIADRYEPNNSFDEVEAHEEGGVDSPNLGLVNAPRAIAGLSIDDAFDFFKFRMNRTAGPGDFVRIESPFGDSDIDLFLFDAWRGLIDGSFSSTNTEQISLAGLPAGEYFIKVTRFFGEVPGYTLTIDPAGNEPPAIEVIRPEAPYVWVERGFEPLPVEWIASDPEGDPTTVSLFMDRDGVLDKETIPIGGYQGLDGSHGFTNVNTAIMDLGEWFLYAEVTDGGAVSGDWAPGSFILYERLEVEIDIKPGSDSNPINLISRGVIPVAILGSGTLDVRDVDVATLAFAPHGSAPAHNKGGHLEDVNDDGFMDLVSHYRTEESGIAFGDTETCITGETFDGTPLEGCDSVETVPPGGLNVPSSSSEALTPSCGIGFELAFLLPLFMWLRPGDGRARVVAE